MWSMLSKTIFSVNSRSYFSYFINSLNYVMTGRILLLMLNGNYELSFCSSSIIIESLSDIDV